MEGFLTYLMHCNKSVTCETYIFKNNESVCLLSNSSSSRGVCSKRRWAPALGALTFAGHILYNTFWSYVQIPPWMCQVVECQDLDCFFLWFLPLDQCIMHSPPWKESSHRFPFCPTRQMLGSRECRHVWCDSSGGWGHAPGGCRVFHCI